MAPSDRPLLARADSQDSIREANEEDALLTGRQIRDNKRSRWSRYREAGLSLYSILATITIVALAIVVSRESQQPQRRGESGWDQDGKPTGKRNLIFMVTDGMGPASLSLTRSFRQYMELLQDDDTLLLDELLVGSSRTKSSSSLITDSAAGATAFSCGMKSYNGAISVTPNRTACGTVLEAAKQAGYLTGLVVTTRLTDATPACFASHANSRAYEDLIAEHMIGHYPLGRMVDVMIGGGRCHFLPNSTEGSCRADNKDVVKLAKDRYGFNYIDNRDDFNNLKSKGSVQLPLLALMAETDIPYEIDRVHVDHIYPSESEMAKLALDALETASKESDAKGFFLMIEGSRIDHAGHGNDPAAQVREVLAHDKTVAAVLKFLDESDTPGLMLGTSDHETGGLSVGRQVGVAYPTYAWYPAVLANASHSASYLGHKWAMWLDTKHGQKATRHEKSKYIRHELFEKDFGIYDANDDEIDAIIDASVFWPPSYIFADRISERADIGWSTHGHTAVDVNIYASDHTHARALVGNHENIEVGQFLADFLEVDVDAVTSELVSKNVRTRPHHIDDDEEMIIAKNIQLEHGIDRY